MITRGCASSSIPVRIVGCTAGPQLTGWPWSVPTGVATDYHSLQADIAGNLQQVLAERVGAGTRETQWRETSTQRLAAWSEAPEPALFVRNVRAGPSLPAALRDCSGERGEDAGDAREVGAPPSALALAGPLRKRPVPPLAVAAATRSDFVFNPRGSPFDAGHQVFGCGHHQASKGARAPYACRAVTLDRRPQPSDGRGLSCGLHRMEHKPESGINWRMAPDGGTTRPGPNLVNEQGSPRTAAPATRMLSRFRTLNR